MRGTSRKTDTARSNRNLRPGSLQAFRDHLADELKRFPEDPEYAFESYAVTTAALARQLLDYLEINDLTIPNSFDDDPPKYPLRKVLGRIIHFTVLYQDAISVGIPGKPDLVTLYSDWSKEFGQHAYILLSDYRECVGRLASDDRYVARHFFPRVIAQLMEFIQESSEPTEPWEKYSHGEERRLASGMVGNAWLLLVTLIRDGEIRCPELPVKCYEHYLGKGDEGYLHIFPSISTGQDLVRGYGPRWIWASIIPGKVEIRGQEKYCMHLRAFKSITAGTKCRLAVTFETFIRMFQAALAELESK